MIKIMLSAGEVSGDVHGANLAHELFRINPKAHLFGMGGEKMKAKGVDIKYDLTSYGTVGIVEILKFLPFILITFLKMKALLKKEKPDLLILIDYQGFNMMLAMYAKKLGIKTIYYISPQEWLWGTSKGVKKVADTITKILCIFENESAIYKKAGGRAIYIGNPNLDIARPSMSKELFCQNLEINPKFPIFGLFPGSRMQEIESLLSILLETASKIKAKVPNAQFVLSLSSEHFREKIGQIIKDKKSDIQIIYGKSYDILNISNISIAASGTTLMEAVIIGAPAIMIYKLSKLSYFIGMKILKIKLRYYCMPNILVNREVIPEFIQDRVTPDNLSNTAIKILTDPNTLDTMKNGYRQIVTKLGTTGAVKRAADEIYSELRGKI